VLAPEAFLRGGLNTREITFVRESGVATYDGSCHMVGNSTLARNGVMRCKTAHSPSENDGYQILCIGR
jgi:hypothetical protein